MLSSRSGRLRLAPRIVLFAIIAYAFVWISGFPRQYDDDELPPDAQRRKTSQAETPHRVDANQLVVTIKTTALDAYAKLPSTLLLTNTIYHETLNVVSDLQMDIGAFHVHDVLDRFDMNFMVSNPDLERYRRQLHFAQGSIDIGMLREADTEKEKEVMARLDKYKYLRMLERAWELKPDRSWYAFVDADTYLVRSNTLAWLGQFDPSEPMFFANPPEYGTNMFVLSGQAMRALLVDREGVIRTWDSRIPGFRSGFDLLTSALSTELRLGFNRTWPGISGFHPATAPYGPGFWCEPIIAMDRVPAELASDMWRLQRDREDYHHIHDPLSFADLWIRFLQPENLFLPRDNWDNLSSNWDNSWWNILFEGTEHKSHASGHIHQHRAEDGRAASGEDSWEACRESCNNNPHCMQYSYSSHPISNHNENGNTKCHLSRSMRLGNHADPQEIEVDGERVQVSWKSGWRKDKFERWAQQQRCKGQQNKN